jgi:hypothetical protein
MHRPRVAAFLFAIALAACQGGGLSSPVSHANAVTPALTPPDSAGILVLPVSGAPSPAATDIAQAMADALQQADVLASTSASNQRSFRLSSTVTTLAAGDGGDAIFITWTLADANGRKLGGAESNTTASEASWARGGDDIARALANPAVPVLAKLIESDAPLPQGNVNPVVALGSVSGAPGDGDVALARAMGAALGRVHVELADPGGKPDYTLSGSVEVSAPSGPNQKVKVSWALLRPDGSEVGRVNQENAVPAGSLDRFWGDIAYAVTAAAAPGVRQLIEQAGNAPGGAS